MTSNTSKSIQSVAAEQAPKAAKPPQSAASPSPTQSSVQGRAATKVGALLHVLASPAAASLIIASVFLVVRYKNKTRAKKVIQEEQVISAKPVTRSMSLALMHGGEKAIKRFMELNKASVEEADLKAALDDIRKELNKLELSKEELNKAELSKEELDKQCINFVDLYAKIGIFEMTEKEDEVIKLLKEALGKAKKRGIDKLTHTTHELKLLLAEMLIYKEEYDEALELLPEEDVSSTADARVLLYKAVIWTMKNQRGTAEKHFNEYIDIRDRFHGIKFYKDAPMHIQVSNFQDFVALVKNIQKVIKTAHPTPSQPVLETGKTSQKDTENEGKTQKGIQTPHPTTQTTPSQPVPQTQNPNQSELTANTESNSQGTGGGPTVGS